MDPQKLSQLDPKLRDAYQRVMGTTIPEPQAAPQQAQTPPSSPVPTPAPTPKPSLNPTPIPAIEEPPAIPTPPTQPPIPEPQPQPEPAIPEPQPSISQPEPIPPAQANNFVQMNSEVQAAPTQNFTVPSPMSPMSQAQNVVIKKKSGMIMPILFGIAGLVFIVIYTLFWTKIFNFKLPFLPF